jgi:HD superfamily phosphohydrolase YqeK
VRQAVGPVDLPPWAMASKPRRRHIARVVALTDRWARALGVAAGEAAAWHDAARWHDALRDAPEQTLREITGDSQRPAELLHGPAAARMLERSGESRGAVLDAIRFHTTGSSDWSRTGRALFMADFLEPGRAFSRVKRAALAARVPHDFDGTFRDVVRMRMEWALREAHALYTETVALWNTVR